jgi:outer membrane protein assembly factor BamA
MRMPLKRMSGFVLGSCFLWLLSAAAAQKSSKNYSVVDTAGYKLVAVKVTGTARYTDKEIIAATGLQIGQNAAEGDFKEAVRRLGDSGLFSDVMYSFTTSGSTVKLELQLSDNGKAKLVPAHFENIVWFTDDELEAALQASVPLFKKLLPLSGNLPDKVSEALQAMLTEKQLPGRVDYLRESGEDESGQESGDEVRSIVFRVDEVSIRIHDVEFPGASPEQSALLAMVARRLAGAEYGRTNVAATAKFDFLPVYLQRGYLKAAFAPSDAHVLPASSSGDAQGPAELEVDAVLPVTPGKVYATSGVDWKGASAIGAGELGALIHLPLEQPANAVRLASDLEKVTKLYRSRGYMMVQIKPDAQLNEEKGTVHYDLNVVEGDLFKMGELEITGLDTQARSKVLAAWTLQAGEPYNAEYARKFLRDADALLPRGVAWAVEIHETPDQRDKTVDVEIHYKQQ